MIRIKFGIGRVHLGLFAVMFLMATVPTEVWAQGPLLAFGNMVENPVTEAARGQTVMEAGLELLASPNSASRHLAMAHAYYERGAINDAVRVNNHLRRVVALDPKAGPSLGAQLQAWKAGIWRSPLPVEMTALDSDVETTLRAAETRRDNEEDHESRIESGLANRLAKSRFPQPSLNYQENLKDLHQVFGYEPGGGGPGGQDLSERFAVLASSRDSGGWREQLRQDFGRVAQMNIAMRGLTSDSAGAGDVSGDDPDALPDPMSTKNAAFVAYREGNIELAYNRLQQAAAAVMSLKRRASEALPTPERSMDSSETPDRAEPAGPTPDRAPPPEPTPDRAPPQVLLPPPVNQEIGEATLEAAEAISDPEVPPEVVDDKLDEVVAIGNHGEPLLLDLNRNGRADLYGSLLPDGILDRETAVEIDLDANGRTERVEWFLPGADALLAYDANENGRIDSGLELFGTTAWSRDGFERLSLFDRDGDGVVRGAELSGLLVWRDDGDGRSQAHELTPVSKHGIERIVLPQGGASRLESTASGPDGTLTVWEWYPDIESKE